MKICFINSLYGSESASAPLGIAYLAAYLRKNNHQVKIIDRVPFYYKNKENIKICDQLTKREILDFKPDMIGFTCMTSQIPDLIYIGNQLRQTPELKNILFMVGGAHVIVDPFWFLKYIPFVEVAVFGEGETTLLDIANGENFETIAGIAFKKNNRIIKNKDRIPSLELDDLPFPARDLLDMDFYCRPSRLVIPGIFTRAVTMITSRGCPGKCNFCASSVIEPKIRWHSIEYVIAEIEKVITDYSKVEMINFVDIMFLGYRNRAIAICEELIKRKINKKIKWAVSVRADAVDKDILSLMKRAGCFYINYGFESGSQKMLDEMNKMTKVEDNFRAAKLTQEAGILVNSAMIIGLPNETEEDFKKTIDFIKKTKIFNASLNILVPLPGTNFYKQFIEEGKLKYDENIWKKTSSTTLEHNEENVFSGIPFKKFMLLYDKVNLEVISPLNSINYIKYNWNKDSLGCLKEIINLVISKIKLKKYFLKIYRWIKK